jgi:hypothetical protein
MVSSKADVMRRQRRWADARGIRYDARGFVRDLRDNLRAPLSRAALAELGRGSELEVRRARPPRISSLCSSAALVANVFGYWHGRDAAPVARALGFAVRGAVSLAFEEPFATGLAGDPPLLDVALRCADGALVAVESKYAEWLVRRPRNKSGLKDKYFPAGSGVWAAAGLMHCQALAEDLQAGRERFTYLHAAQLLKHALALRKARLRSSLVYLYYAWPAREAAVHAAELERARARLDGEVDLRVRTYQELHRALRALPDIDRTYLDYLTDRYFNA